MKIIIGIIIAITIFVLVRAAMRANKTNKKGIDPISPTEVGKIKDTDEKDI